jgi:hypothetical protein
MTVKRLCLPSTTGFLQIFDRKVAQRSGGVPNAQT